MNAPRQLPAILAFVLLALQVALPWTVPHFVTQDGPSHLYTAQVTRAVLTAPDSAYASLYRLNPRPVPNWGGTLAFVAATAAVGPTHAEKLLVSLAYLFGFFALAYAFRAVNPTASPYHPLANFLLQTLFLWLGYHSFYLGMVALMLVLGYFLRHRDAFTPARAAVLSLALAALYFTHLVPTALALLLLPVLAFWTRRAWRPVALVLAATVPTLLLIRRFARSSLDPVHFDAAAGAGFGDFPKKVFITADGLLGSQKLLWLAALGLLVFAIANLSRDAWRRLPGALAVSTLLAFALYFAAPDAGWGGSDAKSRLAWGVFLIGSLLLAALPTPDTLRLPVALFFFAGLLANLAVTFTAVRHYSDAVEDYLAVASAIPPGSTFVRLKFPTPDLASQYGFFGIGREPLYHVDSYIAARCRCVNLSDYQAPNQIFPVIYRPQFSDQQQSQLWGFETAEDSGYANLATFATSLPVKIDYVLVLGDPQPEPPPHHLLLQTSPRRPFVRLYRPQ